LCADLSLTPERGTDHAAYIQSWLKVLKDDKRAIFSAAVHANVPLTFCMVSNPSLTSRRKKESPHKAAPHLRKFRACHSAGASHMVWIYADLLNWVEQIALHAKFDRVLKV